jgi:hypothetical protein
MAWRMSGSYHVSCSCKLYCACNFGPAEPDQGWCSAALLMDIGQGNSDGVDLSNTRVVMALDLPGDFVSGDGTARLYFDEASSGAARRELEAIITGDKGGVWEAIAAGVTKWLPPQTAKIDFQGGENPTATVGSFGQIKLERIKDEAGRQTRVVNAPLFAAFAVESEDVARSHGSRWSDPEMRSWEAGGNGEIAEFSWSG